MIFNRCSPVAFGRLPFTYLVADSHAHRSHAHSRLLRLRCANCSICHMSGVGPPKMGRMSLQFEVGRDLCTVHLTPKFHHPMFNRSKVIVFTNIAYKQANKEADLVGNTHLARLCYTPLENVVGSLYENAGVENAGATTYGKPPKQKTPRYCGVPASTARSQMVFER